MNILPVVKSLAGFASSLGAGTVVGNAIKATTPDELSKLGKVLVSVGSVALSGAAGSIASKWIEDEIQKFADDFKSARVTASAKIDYRVPPPSKIDESDNDAEPEEAK